MLGLMTISLLIRAATEIHDDLLPHRGNLSQWLEFSPTVIFLYSFIYYRGDNKTEEKLAMNFGSGDMENELKLE
jgi:hypothetical protein